MDSKGASTAVPPTQTYEDFVPSTDLVQEEDSDTLLLNLTGFKKEHVRVQLTRTGVLKISGQRPIGQNKWLRFQKDFPVSENCDKTKISAKFENGILYVKQPKLITSSEKKDKELPALEAPGPKKPDNEPQHIQKTKNEEQAKGIETKQANAENTAEPAKEEPKNDNTKTSEQPEAKSFPEKTPAEKSSTSSTTEDGKATSYSSKPENESRDDAKMGTETASCLAAKLKMPRKMMKMTLVALLVLGIGLYVTNVMKSSNNAEE